MLIRTYHATTLSNEQNDRRPLRWDQLFDGIACVSSVRTALEGESRGPETGEFISKDFSYLEIRPLDDILYVQLHV